MSEAEAFQRLRQAATDSASAAKDERGREIRWSRPSADSLIGALPERQSVKYFAPEVIDAGWLLTLTLELFEFDRQFSGDRAPLRYICAVSRVLGLDPGLYELSGDGWERLDAPFEPSDLKRMTLQPEFGDAAMILILVGSLRTAVTDDGPNGHRVLLQRAGAVAEATWLASVREGLSASIFAGFLAAELKSRLGFDGVEALQLIALAVGKGDHGRLALLEAEAEGAMG